MLWGRLVRGSGQPMCLATVCVGCCSSFCLASDVVLALAVSHELHVGDSKGPCVHLASVPSRLLQLLVFALACVDLCWRDLPGPCVHLASVPSRLLQLLVFALACMDLCWRDLPGPCVHLAAVPSRLLLPVACLHGPLLVGLAGAMCAPGCGVSSSAAAAGSCACLHGPLLAGAMHASGFSAFSSAAAAGSCTFSFGPLLVKVGLPGATLASGFRAFSFAAAAGSCVCCSGPLLVPVRLAGPCAHAVSVLVPAAAPVMAVLWRWGLGSCTWICLQQGFPTCNENRWFELLCMRLAQREQLTAPHQGLASCHTKSGTQLKADCAS